MSRDKEAGTYNVAPWASNGGEEKRYKERLTDWLEKTVCEKIIGLKQ